MADKFKMEFKYRKFTDGLIRELSNARALWFSLRTWLDRIRERMFKNWGGEYGRPTWSPIAPSMYGKVRTGTNGSRVGTYSSGSKPLQASFTYKRSIRELGRTPTQFWYGSRHPLAGIMPNAGSNRADGGFRKRFVMPNPDSAQFKKEIGFHQKWFLNQAVKKSLVSGTRA